LCSTNGSDTTHEIHGDDRPLDGRPRGPAIDGAGRGTPNAILVSIKRSYNAIRFNTHRYGADVNYLVGRFWATCVFTFAPVKFMVYTIAQRISLSH
jgi:hypothetical protein